MYWEPRRAGSRPKLPPAPRTRRVPAYPTCACPECALVFVAELQTQEIDLVQKIVASFATVLVAAGVSLVAVAAPVSAVDASLLAPSANVTFVTEGDAIFNSTS